MTTSKPSAKTLAEDLADRGAALAVDPRQASRRQRAARGGGLDRA